jgi:hypothetical protein
VAQVKMSTTLYIVAACADKKRYPPDRGARLRSHSRGSVAERVASFTAALAEAGPRLPASELYVGPYWATVRSLPEIAASAGRSARLWVASAGYGLIPASATVSPYSATFQIGHPDSVADPRSSHPVGEQLSGWWNELTRRRGSSDPEPRSLAELATGARRATVLLIVSPRYFQAMRGDLLRTAETLGERLIVISSQRLRDGDPLHANVVVSESRLTNVVGGALPSLHARVAARMLRDARSRAFTAATIRTLCAEIASTAAPRRVFARRPMSDDEVLEFIRRATARESSRASHTGLLRELRSNGLACEQKRFKRLFEEASQP